MAKVTVRLDPDDYHLLCDVARANGILVTEVARSLIQDKIIELMTEANNGTD